MGRIRRTFKDKPKSGRVKRRLSKHARSKAKRYMQRRRATNLRKLRSRHRSRNIAGGALQPGWRGTTTKVATPADKNKVRKETRKQWIHETRTSAPLLTVKGTEQEARRSVQRRLSQFNSESQKAKEDAKRANMLARKAAQAREEAARKRVAAKQEAARVAAEEQAKARASTPSSGR